MWHPPFYRKDPGYKNYSPLVLILGIDIIIQVENSLIPWKESQPGRNKAPGRLLRIYFICLFKARIMMRFGQK